MYQQVENTKIRGSKTNGIDPRLAGEVIDITTHAICSGVGVHSRITSYSIVDGVERVSEITLSFYREATAIHSSTPDLIAQVRFSESEGVTVLCEKQRSDGRWFPETWFVGIRDIATTHRR